MGASYYPYVLVNTRSSVISVGCQWLDQSKTLRYWIVAAVGVDVGSLHHEYNLSLMDQIPIVLSEGYLDAHIVRAVRSTSLEPSAIRNSLYLSIIGKTNVF